MVNLFKTSFELMINLISNSFSAYNEFKTELSDYLKKFATNNKVVREEDIQEFFSGLQAKKRQKVAHPIPFNCR